MLSTKSMSCSTTISECLPRSSFSNSPVRSVSASVIPATGSSSSSSLGSCMSSMPISSHCFWPCDSRPAGRKACSSSRMSARVEPMASTCSPLRRASSVARTPLSIFIASSRFSNTEWFSNTVGRWNLRPMPAWAICGSLIRVRSMVWPKNAVPVSGRVLPVITSIIVVLPAPLGPITQRSSPTPMSSVSLLSARKPSKDTVMSSRYRMAPWDRSTPAGATWP